MATIRSASTGVEENRNYFRYLRVRLRQPRTGSGDRAELRQPAFERGWATDAGRTAAGRGGGARTRTRGSVGVPSHPSVVRVEACEKNVRPPKGTLPRGSGVTTSIRGRLARLEQRSRSMKRMALSSLQ